MKDNVIKILRNTGIISISLIAGLGIFITFAAITWPSAVPNGEAPGGLFSQAFQKILVNPNLQTTDGTVVNADKLDGLHASDLIASSAGGGEARTCYYVSNFYHDKDNNLGYHKQFYFTDENNVSICGQGFEKMPGKLFNDKPSLVLDTIGVSSHTDNRIMYDSSLYSDGSSSICCSK